MTTTTDLEAAMDTARKAGDSPIDGFVERLAERIGAKVNVSTVFGEPVERAGITVIPVAKVRWGFGGGAGGPAGVGPGFDDGSDGGTGATDEATAPGAGARGTAGQGGGGGATADPVGWLEIGPEGAVFKPITPAMPSPGFLLAAGAAGALVLRGSRSSFAASQGPSFVAGTSPPPPHVEPGPGQESVWDYPRPPRIEAVPERIRVVVDGVEIGSSDSALRVLETAGAPVYYLPPGDVRSEMLLATDRATQCEWKGEARYWSIATPGGRVVPNAAWSYQVPLPGYEAIAGHVAFYAWAVDEAWVGDELATPQPGHFYGGWVTSRIVGPFKGGPGSFGW